jgi:iron(III) transport system permease protein
MRHIRRYGLFGLAAAAMFLIVVVPLAIVIVQGFIVYERGAWHFSLGHIGLVLGRSHYWIALLNTVIIGLGATTIACAVGVPMAWLFARTNLPGRGFLEKLATIPIFGIAGKRGWWIAKPCRSSRSDPTPRRSGTWEPLSGRSNHISASFQWPPPAPFPL